MAGIFFAISLLVMGVGFIYSGWLGVLGLGLVAYAGSRKGARDFTLLLSLMFIIGVIGSAIQVITWLLQ